MSIARRRAERSSDWDLYQADKDEWSRRLDRVVNAAEEVNVGLIPNLFRRTGTHPDLLGEYCDQWGNPQSGTRSFMATEIRRTPSI